MGSGWRWRRAAFKDRLDENAFADFAQGNGWWYAGREERKWLGPVPTWYSLDGVITRFYAAEVLSVPFVEVTAEKTEIHQRAMADTEAMLRREFRCFTTTECLNLVKAAKEEAKAPALVAVAVCAPDWYCEDVAEVVMAGLFAPQPKVRAAALHAVMLTEWPQLARPLAAQALTETKSDLAGFARDLSEEVYGYDVDEYFVAQPRTTRSEKSSNIAETDDSDAVDSSERSSVRPSIARPLGAAVGRLEWRR